MTVYISEINNETGSYVSFVNGSAPCDSMIAPPHALTTLRQPSTVPNISQFDAEKEIAVRTKKGLAFLRDYDYELYIRWEDGPEQQLMHIDEAETMYQIDVQEPWGDIRVIPVKQPAVR